MFLIAGCHKEAVHEVQFYYWKTVISLGSVEQEYFRQLNSNKLYIRFFDVDKKDGRIVPLAVVRPFENRLPDAEYIPVIFITNRTFTGISEEKLNWMVEHIIDLTEDICRKNHLKGFQELQIDCDWTQRTRDVYFRFLDLLKKQSGKKLSCTLRLHQVKYSKETGIPPVDKGILMCYATSDPTDNATKNSILDIDLLKDYTASIEAYPLNYDIALPLYSWAIVTNHLGNLKLINNISEGELDSTVFRRIDDHLYEVQKDYFFRGFYLNKGFTVKIETITPELLQEAKRYLHHKIRHPYDIIYYHLDEPFLKQFTIQNLK